MIQVVLDYETRSRLSLTDTGVYKYARHPSTEVLCVAYSTDEYEEEIWRPSDGGFPLADLWPCNILAFNAAFEAAIWQFVCVPKYGWPPLPVDCIECLQARSAYAGLPRKLDRVSTALGLGSRGKDKSGHLNMLRLCKPTRAKKIGCEYLGGTFDEFPERHRKNEAYCLQDVVAENYVARLAKPLPPFEQRLWRVHREINERGVPVDLELCRKAAAMAEQERERLSGELLTLTGNKVETPNQIARLKDWMESAGCPLPNLQEETVLAALQENSLPKPARKVLQIRKWCRDAAVAKYKGVLNHADADGYCREAHVYYKAGTGRWSGTGPQFQNLRQLDENETPGYVDLADKISASANPDRIRIRLQQTDAGVIPALAAMVRMAVCAHQGKKLVVCDYSSIEMRVLHWLAGDAQTLKQIEAFDKGAGEEPYKIAAAGVFDKQVGGVTKAERKIGKVMILGCGYMSGAEKFAAFCGGYGVDMPLDKSQELVQFYRRSYPPVKNFWYALGKAAVQAVKHRKRTQCGPLEFCMVGCTLNARLPSGREMKYYDAAVVGGQYGDELEALDQRSGLRRVVGLPVLVENVDQAMSRDLLAGALVKCRAERLPVVLHVHDEIVLEVPQGDDKSATTLRQIMTSVPPWAEGLPVDVKLGESRRYTK